MRIELAITAALCALSITVHVHAADVTSAGSDANTGAEWRTPSVTKTLDADGDNVYGTAGYVVFATTPIGTKTADVTVGDPLGSDGTLKSIPSFLTLSAAEVSVGTQATAHAFGYPEIDNPGNSSGPKLQAGMAAVVNATAASAVVSSPVMDIKIGKNFPAGGVRVGVMATGFGSDVPTSFELKQTSGTGSGSASADAVKTEQFTIGYVFFDIKNAAPDDVLTLTVQKHLSGSDQPTVSYVGLTFDEIKK